MRIAGAYGSRVSAGAVSVAPSVLIEKFPVVDRGIVLPRRFRLRRPALCWFSQQGHEAAAHSAAACEAANTAATRASSCPSAAWASGTQR